MGAGIRPSRRNDARGLKQAVAAPKPMTTPLEPFAYGAPPGFCSACCVASQPNEPEIADPNVKTASAGTRMPGISARNVPNAYMDTMLNA